jgi:hypothetical protein
MIFRQPLFSLVLILLLSSTAFTQKPTPSPQADAQRKAQQELQGKAISLLEDVVKDSESFKHAENRISIKALAANILWPHDEARARILFKEAMASLAELLNNQESVDEQARPKMLEGPQRLRRELLQMLAQRDARLARDFLYATRPQGSKPGDRRDARPDQPLELSLATRIAETDPKLALEIAEESLSTGLAYDLPPLLSVIRQKDPEGAARIANQVVVKLRAEKFDSSDMAKQVAVSLLRQAAQSAEEDAAKGAKANTPLLDQQTMRELIEMIAAEALRPSSTSPELLGPLQEMLPVVEKYSPARAAQVKRKTEPQKMTENKPPVEKGTDNEESNNEATTLVEDESRYSTLIEKGSVDELLAEAAKAPEPMRQMLYQRASTKAMEDGDADRARSIVNERIKDPDQRKMMLSELDNMAAMKAAQQGKIEQTRKMLATLRTNEERVMLLVQLATGAAANGEKKIALQLLDEARGMIGSRAKNFTQLGVQVAVARAYAPLDAARSLAILEPVVDQLNELISAAVVLGAFITEEIIQDDEIMMEPLAMISGEVFVLYINDVNVLASADFERTKALADRFQRDEIRISARLLMAQSILSPQEKQNDASFSVIEIKKQ